MRKYFILSVIFSCLCTMSVYADEKQTVNQSSSDDLLKEIAEQSEKIKLLYDEYVKLKSQLNNLTEKNGKKGDDSNNDQTDSKHNGSISISQKPVVSSEEGNRNSVNESLSNKNNGVKIEILE